MFFIHWLNRTSRRSTAIRQPSRDRTKERRLKLLRLEQRRVLNADFTFAAHALQLDHIDGDLTVREVSGSTGHQIEFDLHGSVWQNDGSTGLFAIDNSTPDHSILSIAKSDLESLASGVSLHAAASGFDLQFDTHSSAIDLSLMQGALVAEGFGEIHQTAANENDVRLNDVSLSASHITLSHFHGDDITLNASEIDLTGGANSISGSTLSIHSAGTSSIELGGTSDSDHELNFTHNDITALDASFHRISIEAISANEASSIHVDAAGADFHDAIAAGHETSLHLTADSVQIDGALSISGGLIDVTATHDVTISETGSLMSHGGQVHVDAGRSGTLFVSGHVDVSDSEPDGVGGSVYLLGERVGLFGHAEVDASGHSGGGEIHIGGDLHGDDIDAIPHAAQSFVGPDVEIHTDALQQGDGGQVVVWSDEVTQVYGSLTARGGAIVGDGGFIETSSHQQLIVTRGGDASATNGKAGTWLLDPYNIKIVLASSVYETTEFAQPPNFNPTIRDSEVTVKAIRDLLEVGTDVIISTADSDDGEDPPGDDTDDDQPGNVTLETDLDVTFMNSGDSATLIISAANDIFINGQIIGTNGSLNVFLQANEGTDDLDPSAGNVNINANITIDGSFTSTGVDFDSAGQKMPPEVPVPNVAATIAAKGGVSITHSGIVDLGVINTGTDFGGTTFISGANVHGTIDVREGNVFIDGGNPDLIVTANISATGTIFLLADQDVIVQATVTAGISPLLPTDPLDPSADLSITADAESNGDGGFWLREGGNTEDARLDAGGNITIVGAKLIDSDGNPDDIGNPNDGKISLRIDVAETATDPQIVAGQDLTIVANFGNVSDAGDIVLNGIMQATDGSLTAFFTGMTSLSANQSAGTDLLFQNAVELTKDVTLTAGNDATIASTIDDDDEPATGSALTVTAGGDVLFVGKVGGLVTPGLDSLTVTGDGLIDFLNSVTVDGNILVTATSETGRLTFQDVVTTNVGSVTIKNAGLLVTSSAAQFNVATNFVQDGAGTTELGAGIKTENGNVSFAQAVLLTRGQQIMPPDPLFDPLTTIDTSKGNGNITFGGGIDSEVAGANEEQTISLGNLTGSNFKISWVPPNPPGSGGEETTADIDFDATAADVKAALVEFESLTDADIDVTGDPGGPFTLTFRGAFRGTDVNEVTVSGTGLNLAGDPSPVLTTLPGEPIVAEHNPLTLVAGTGEILFRGDIGAGFVDVGLGVDGDQTIGNLTIESANKVTFDGVTTVATNGTIDLGAGDDPDDVITAGITINGTDPIAFQSDQDIRINGQVTSAVDLSLFANGGVTLTDVGNILTTTNDSNITIVADSDGSSAGDFTMGVPTFIDSGAGFIDVRAAEVNLGKLTSASLNPTDSDNPAIRVVATFKSINDINEDDLNLVANQRDPLDDQSTGAGVVLEAVLGIGTIENWLETDLASLSAFNHDRSEQQVITLEKATGGTFTLEWDPPGAPSSGTTAPIPFNATADQVKAAFRETFDSLTDADLDVSGKAGGPFIFTFLGALQVTNVDAIVAENVDLIGVGAEVKATTIADPIRAENNLVIHDEGTTAGRVDLIFAHNQANQLEQQFAMATVDFGSATLLFSAATPGEANNDIIIRFTSSNHVAPVGMDPIGPTAGVPIITVVDHEITIDLDSNKTTANAVRDAINNNHQANVLIRALITSDYQSGFSDIAGTAAGMDVTFDPNVTATATEAGAEDGIIDINIEQADLRVVADNSRLVLSEMQKGIDTFNPPDLAVAAVQSENTIKLTAGTIEVFDDILAIQDMTQTTLDLDADATTFTVIDPSVFINFDGTPFDTPFLIKITTEIDQIVNVEVISVTSIDGNDLTVERAQNGTSAAPIVAGTIIETINRDNGIHEHISLQARVNFVLGADRVISTDDHYINSLNLQEDLNGNGVLDAVEPFDDANSNGVFDPGEPFIDANGNGVFDTGESFYDANHDTLFTPGESFTDVNLNGRYDDIEDFNNDTMPQFNLGEDTNQNGLLDPDEDINGNGRLDLRGDKPATIATDDFFSNPQHDFIQIIADSDHSGGDEGRVLLGENSTVSTDNGIEQEIAPRPVKFGTDPRFYTYAQNTAFFSGEVVASNLTSRFLFSTTLEQIADGTFLPRNSIVYLGTLTFTIGVPGEKNLILDVDWGDHDRTPSSPVPPVLANTLAPKFVNGVYVFDPTVDQHATRFLIPEGGAKYSIPHDFPDSAVNLMDLLGQAINTPGRELTSDRLQVRFAVSQHSSIVIDGQSALDPSVQPEDVTKAAPDALVDTPKNAPPVDEFGRALNFPYASDNPALVQADPLFQLSSTNVLDQTDMFLPRFDNGIAAFSIPTAPSAPILPPPPPILPPELPKPYIPDNPLITVPQITTESSRSSASSSSVATDEFFELRRINEDGTTTVERLTDFGGEGLLERSRFEKFVSELGDGEYEIWFVTREIRNGALIERPVIQFRLESGRLAPPANDSPTLFKPFRLIPVPKVPKPDKPVKPDADGAAADDMNPDTQPDPEEDPSNDEMSALPGERGPSPLLSGTALAAGQLHSGTAPAAGDLLTDHPITDHPPIDSDPSDTSALAVGLGFAAGLRWRKNRFNPFGTSPFSRAARLARKQFAPADDQ